MDENLGDLGGNLGYFWEVWKLKRKEYFEPIYKATESSLYYPSQKNTGIFITKLFLAGGSNFFQLPNGKVTANKVETQRKIYNGNFELTPEQKDSFNPVDIGGLISFFQKNVRADKIRDLMQCYGIPDQMKISPELFFKSLALQFEAFVKSSEQEVEDIVAMEYQHLLDHGDTPSEVPIRTKYPFDSALISPNQARIHRVSCHEKKMIHEWIIQNRGRHEWKGRKLYFQNHAEVRPRAVSNYVDIPDTPVGQYVKIATSIDARRYEGTTICHWIMIDDQGEDCFPNSRMFDITLIAEFVYEPRKTEV